MADFFAMSRLSYTLVTLGYLFEETGLRPCWFSAGRWSRVSFLFSFPHQKEKTFFWRTAVELFRHHGAPVSKRGEIDNSTFNTRPPRPIYIWADVVLLDFNRARDCLNARAPLSSNTKPTAVLSPHICIDQIKSIQILTAQSISPPNSHRRRRSTTFFGFFFLTWMWWRVGKSQKTPKKLIFLIFSDDNYFWLDGHSQSGHHTQLPALRCAADKLSSTQSSAIRKEKNKKCVCVFIILWKLFSKKFRVMMWRVRFHNTEYSVLSVP